MVGLERYTVAADKLVPAWTVTIRYEFAYDFGGLGKGGGGALFVNGEKAAEGRIESRNGYACSANETEDVGTDDTTPVIQDYHDNKYTGKIHKVTIDLKQTSDGPGRSFGPARRHLASTSCQEEQPDRSWPWLAWRHSSPLP